MDIVVKLSDFLIIIIEKMEKMGNILVSKPEIQGDISYRDSDGFKVFWKKESPIKEFVRYVKDIQETLTEMGK